MVNPNYRVLLYPHKQGDPLPQVSKTDTGVTITIGDQVRKISLIQRQDGRAQVSITK